MGVVFFCQSCGARFEVEARLAGKKGRCKQCGQYMTVPKAEHLASMWACRPWPWPARGLPPRARCHAQAQLPRQGRSHGRPGCRCRAQSMSDWLNAEHEQDRPGAALGSSDPEASVPAVGARRRGRLEALRSRKARSS